MGPKAYLALTVIGAVGMFASFVLFIVMMATGDIFYYESVFIIILTIFGYLGAVCFFILLMVFGIVKFSVAQQVAAQKRPLTKKCVSCGHEIGYTDMSCSRCFTLQPPTR